MVSPGFRVAVAPDLTADSRGLTAQRGRNAADARPRAVLISDSDAFVLRQEPLRDLHAGHDRRVGAGGAVRVLHRAAVTPIDTGAPPDSDDPAGLGIVQ